MVRDIISGWAGPLEQFFYPQEQAYAAIMQCLDGQWSLCRYSRQDDGWVQSGADCCRGGGWDEETQAAAPVEILAEWAAVELARRGWQGLPLLYVVPEGELIGYAINLPPHLNPEQQSEAAFWELDDKLTARGLTAGSFDCLCIPLASSETESRCVIWAVRREYLQEVKSAFAAAELKLADVIGGGEIGSSAEQAMEAYLAGRQEQRGFCHHPAAALAIGRVAFCWLLCLLFIFGLWAAIDVYHYEQAQNAAERQTAELARLQPEQKEMERTAARCRDIEAREQLLKELQEKSVPWYSLLVHLGTNTTDGVFLTGLTVTDDGQCLRLAGQAVTYDALAEFVGKLEADADFFPQGVKLENSAMIKGRAGAPDRIDFSLSVKEGQANDGAEDDRKAKSI